jgi:hypothetical protein
MDDGEESADEVFKDKGDGTGPRFRDHAEYDEEPNKPREYVTGYELELTTTFDGPCEPQTINWGYRFTID